MEKSFEWWIENIMDDRLEYLDAHEKYKLYREWLKRIMDEKDKTKVNRR